jgi:hypothetical protein
MARAAEAGGNYTVSAQVTVTNRGANAPIAVGAVRAHLTTATALVGPTFADAACGDSGARSFTLQPGASTVCSVAIPLPKARLEGVERLRGGWGAARGRLHRLG